MNNLGRALRRLRLLRGWKQSHLAEMLGVAQTTISRWEGGLLAMSCKQQAAVRRLLEPGSGQDAALKRLVETSSQKIHLIGDRSHRLLAVSSSRQADWRADASDLLDKSLLGYASPEILAAEGVLDALGWHDGEVNSMTIETGANGDPIVPIVPGRVLWERFILSDGEAARLVTTIC